MREAITQYVNREEARESLKQEALASWTEFQETGRHLTGKEVRTWLKKWGTEAETELPECHK
jgi:predicted transcriptional regulator